MSIDLGWIIFEVNVKRGIHVMIDWFGRLELIYTFLGSAI